MKITDITTEHYSWPRARPIRNGKYTYTTAGTYTITLRVSNPGGSETTTRSVTVPSATVSASPSPTTSPSATPSTPADPACTMVASFTWNETGNSKKIKVTSRDYVSAVPIYQMAPAS